MQSDTIAIQLFGAAAAVVTICSLMFYLYLLDIADKRQVALGPKYVAILPLLAALLCATGEIFVVTMRVINDPWMMGTLLFVLIAAVAYSVAGLIPVEERKKNGRT